MVILMNLYIEFVEFDIHYEENFFSYYTTQFKEYRGLDDKSPQIPQMNNSVSRNSMKTDIRSRGLINKCS